MTSFCSPLIHRDDLITALRMSFRNDMCSTMFIFL